MNEEKKRRKISSIFWRNLWWILPVILALLALLFIFSDGDGLSPFKYEFF